MIRETTQARYIAVLKDFKMYADKKENGKQVYSFEYIINQLSRKHYYTEFMIIRIVSTQGELLQDDKPRLVPVQTQLGL